MKKLFFFFSLCSVFVLLNLVEARAAIFDAADYREPGKYSVGSFGEFILNNPSGEGVEVRAKRGINDMVNLEPFLGFGRKQRGFRFGVAAPINFFPDTENQPGISLLMTGQYVKRETYSGINFQGAPMIHKIVAGVDHLPLNLYLGFPFSLELYDGKYKTGLQMAFGGLYDVSRDGTYYLNSEAGLSLNHSESYVLFGGGIRFAGGSASSRAVHWNDENPVEKDREEPKPNVLKTKSVDDNEEYKPEE